MKKFLLSLGVLLCCAVASHAQVEYPDVPLGDSAYADIYLLWQQELVSSYSPPTRARAQTRYEFAVAIARLLDSQLNLQLSSKDGTFKPTTPTPVTSSLNKPEVTAALKRLANKFLPELKAFDIDIEEIKINGVFLIEREGASHTQTESPDVPLDDSAYDDIYLLLEQEIIGSYLPPTRNLARTRYEFAVAIARLLEGFNVSTADRKSSPVDIPVDAVAALKRLANKFLPELKELGVNTGQIKINGVFLIEPKIAPIKIKVAPQFSDVPKNHWAFEAVEKLRQSGIIIGYPDNSSRRSG